jgi:hypothetical protein
MKTIGYILGAFVLGVIVGLLYPQFANHEQTPPVIVQKPIKANVIKRDYATMPEADIVKALHDYDYGTPILFIEPLKKDEYRAHAALGDREWSRDFTIEAGSDGSFKYYIAAGVVGAGLGGYLIYKLVK